MSRALGFLFFLLFLAGLALTTLQSKRGAPPTESAVTVPKPQYSIVAADWFVPDSSGESAPRMFVRFEADGKISGFGGCNSFFGTYVATDSTLKVSPLSATGKACAEPVLVGETGFLQAVAAAASYQIDGNTLVINVTGDSSLTLRLNTTNTD